jgi:hypothetical protein
MKHKNPQVLLQPFKHILQGFELLGQQQLS